MKERAPSTATTRASELPTLSESHATRYWLGQEVTVRGIVTRVDDDGVDEAAVYVSIDPTNGFWLSVCSDKLVGRTGRVVS